MSKLRVLALVLTMLAMNLVWITPSMAETIFSCSTGGTYTVVDGHITESLDCSGELVIDSSVTAINDYAFAPDVFVGPPTWFRSQNPNITSLSIPNSVLTIGANAFQNIQISELVIPASVISIGASAFEGSSTIISISIPNSVTTVGEDAFRQQNNVTELKISTQASIIERDTYQGFRYLSKFVVPEGVTQIGNGVFVDWYSVTSFTLPSTLTTLGWMPFRGMRSLRTINIPSNLSTINDPFGYFYSADSAPQYFCSKTGVSDTSSVNEYFETLIAYNTSAGRCSNSFDAPAITGVSFPSSTSSTVNFTPPNNYGAGNEISSYSVTAFPGGKRVTVSGADARSVTLSSLTPGKAYVFEVSAMNDESPIITSPPSTRSASITCCTAQASQEELAAAALVAQKAAAAKREAEKQAARTEISKGFFESKMPTIQQFATAEILGVTEKNFPMITNELMAMPDADRSDIKIIEKVSRKYLILDTISFGASFSRFYAKDLSSVGIIPIENQFAITYALRQLPLGERDNYEKIVAAINAELEVIRIRDERLAAILALRESRQSA